MKNIEFEDGDFGGGPSAAAIEAATLRPRSPKARPRRLILSREAAT
jgi:hypothetical protein